MTALFSLFLPLFIFAGEIPITELESHCWSEAVEEGAFLCQDLFLMGKVEGKYVYPLRTVDGGDKNAWAQADQACLALGFGYSSGFRLDESTTSADFLRFDPQGSAFLFQSRGTYIRHLLCR